jgi:hypothetical protein
MSLVFIFINYFLKISYFDLRCYFPGLECIRKRVVIVAYLSGATSESVIILKEHNRILGSGTGSDRLKTADKFILFNLWFI